MKKLFSKLFMAILALCLISCIDVPPASSILESIEIQTYPMITEYKVGDAKLITDDMVVIATYSDGRTAIVTDYTLSGFDSSKAVDSQTITVSYTSEGVTKTTTFTIKIVNNSEPEEISSYTIKYKGNEIGTLSAFMINSIIQNLVEDVDYKIDNSIFIVLSDSCYEVISYYISSGNNNDDEGLPKGKKGYLTFRFDVSDINEEYNLTVTAPEDIEIKHHEDFSEDTELDINTSDYSFPKVFVTVGDKKYLILWKDPLKNHLDATLPGDLEPHPQYGNVFVYGVSGRIVTLKGVLHECVTVTFESHRGTAPENITVLKDVDYYDYNLPLPSGVKERIFKEYVVNGESVRKEAGAQYAYKFSEDTKLTAVYKVPSIGDVFLADGTIVSRNDITNNYQINPNNKPAAIVIHDGTPNDGFFCDDVIAIGLQFGKSLQWSTYESGNYPWEELTEIEYKARNANILIDDFLYIHPNSFINCKPENVLTSEDNDNDGSDNWDLLKEVDEEAVNNSETVYPAFAFAEKYAETYGITGDELKTWYIPSANVIELFTLRSYELRTKRHWDYLGSNVSFGSVGQDWINMWSSNVYKRNGYYREPVYCLVHSTNAASLDYNLGCVFESYSDNAATSTKTVPVVIKLSKD